MRDNTSEYSGHDVTTGRQQLSEDQWPETSPLCGSPPSVPSTRGEAEKSHYHTEQYISDIDRPVHQDIMALEQYIPVPYSLLTSILGPELPLLLRAIGSQLR